MILPFKVNCDHKCHTQGLNPWIQACPICGCNNPAYKPDHNPNDPEHDPDSASLDWFKIRVRNKPKGDYVAGYECSQCGICRWVEIPNRSRSVDIKIWMEIVGRRVSADHSIAAPSCKGQSCNLFIPMNEDGEYGKFPEGMKPE